eukprot:g7670.t1
MSLPREGAEERRQQQQQQQRQSSRSSSSSGGGGGCGGSGLIAGALALACAVLAPPHASGPWLLCSSAAAAATSAHSSSSSGGGGRGAALAAPPGEREGGGAGDEGAGGGGIMMRAPKVPFCRAGADVANMWMPVWDSDSQAMVKAKRVVVFGGKGVDYYNRRAGDELTYLSDMWALHITNTGFKWNKVTPHGQVQPSPRWQTGDSVAFGSSLIVYGGDDQTTNQVGGLGDLWVYSPRGASSRLHAGGYYDDSATNDDWKAYTRGGMHPGERREPSLTMINSTLLLQGGRVDDGESNERCDSRFFLVDLADPDGIWREGPSFPGECGLGQTMNTVNFTRGHAAGESKVRAVVFGGCKWDSDGMFVCSNDLYAYSLEENRWEEIIPKSDSDAFACAADDTEGEEGSLPLRSAPGSSLTSTPANLPPSSSSSSAASPVGASSGSSGTGGSSTEDGVGGGKTAKKPVVCPGESTSRPLGRHAHASAYIESKADNVHALFIFGGRENNDDLTPLGDLWTFDFRTMRWSEITPGSKQAPPNRFYHSLTVWQGGAGDGVASLVVFGGETITRTGQTAYLNDVWLYTPHTGAWREVSRSDCKEGATGVVGGTNWAPIVALMSLLVLVVLVQCLLHYICPTYHPPTRRRRRRSRRKTEDASTSGSALSGGGINGVGGGGGGAEEDGVKRGKSAPSLVTQGLLASSSSNPDKPSYQALA